MPIICGVKPMCLRRKDHSVIRCQVHTFMFTHAALCLLCWGLSVPGFSCIIYCQWMCSECISQTCGTRTTRHSTSMPLDNVSDVYRSQRGWGQLMPWETVQWRKFLTHTHDCSYKPESRSRWPSAARLPHAAILHKKPYICPTHHTKSTALNELTTPENRTSHQKLEGWRDGGRKDKKRKRN